MMLFEGIIFVVCGFAAIYLSLGLLDKAWTVVHEFSHLIAAKLTCGVEWWEMKVTPHEIDGKRVAGSVKYQPIKELTKGKHVIIKLAPFMVSTLACILLPIAVFNKSIIISLILIAGVLDQVGGSLVDDDMTWDMPHAARNLNVPLWVLRTCSLSIVLVSVAISSYLYIDVLVSMFK